MFFKIGGKHVFWSLFLIKLQPEDLQIYYKKTSTQVFSCEIFEISKCTFFTEHIRWMLLSVFELQCRKKNTCKPPCRTCLPLINQIRSDLQVLKTYLNVSNVKLKQQQQQKRNTITSTFIFMWWWVSSRPKVICKKSLRPATWPATWPKKETLA